MAIKKVYIGSVGPFLYDDANSIDDPDFPAENYKGLITDGHLYVGGTPTDDKHVLRKEDIGDITGNVVGPSSSTDNAIVRFDGTNGKIIQDSLVTIDDAGKIDTPSTIKLGSVPIYADNASAIAGGLAAGDIYRTGDDPDLLCIVH